MEKQLQQELLRTGYVHFPLNAPEGGTMEERQLQKPALQSAAAWDGAGEACWRFTGDGSHRVTEEGLELTTAPAADHWPEDENQDGRYATFGSYTAYLDLRQGEWAQTNRLVFEIRPECDGLHSACIRVGFANDGATKIPDAYTREGFHCMNLTNHEWNRCVWEYDSIPHDKMTELLFRVHRYGRETSGSDTLRYTLRNIRLETIATPDVKSGWQCGEGLLSYSTSGYWRKGGKVAIANVAGDRFELLDAATGAVAYSGAPTTVQSPHGTFTTLDFSAFEGEGRFALRMGNVTTPAFPINDAVMESAAWRILNFLYCERCGYPVPGKHGSCHHDILARHAGLTVVYNGGWHDAADVSQQALQSAETTQALLEAAVAAKDDPLLHSRLLEEAIWGLDFILRMRFPDGYRATSVPIRRWNDNYIGTLDDMEARVFSNPFDHFVIAGVEAYAARALAEADPALAWKCGQQALADWRLGHEIFSKEGIVLTNHSEHCYGAGLSQHYAEACWSAALICKALPDAGLTDLMAAYARKLVACQDTGEAGVPLTGFFYRDEQKKSIEHFNHQSREYVFAQALAAACEACPAHADFALWQESLRLYGEYIKRLRAYAAPYGMLPAGVYSLSEAEDVDTFAVMNMLVNYEREKENLTAQIASGEPLGGDKFVRQFPICFSYRGNTALVMATAKAAAIAGRRLGDKALLEIAREQFYWVAGRNPFCQSLIYGEGSNYGQQYTALLGETVGEIAVGVENLGNTDLPYWPPACIATYREVWLSSATRWLWALADVYRD